MNEQREQLAALCHDQWSGWMNYLFSKGEFKEGRFIITEESTTRWLRQAATPYSKLSEREQDSDRKEADKFLNSLAFEKEFKKGYVKGIENYGVLPLKTKTTQGESNE